MDELNRYFETWRKGVEQRISRVMQSDPERGRKLRRDADYLIYLFVRLRRAEQRLADLEAAPVQAARRGRGRPPRQRLSAQSFLFLEG